MYTQHRPEDGRILPQNYSGNAFRYPPIGKEETEELWQEKQNKASPPALTQQPDRRMMPIYEDDAQKPEPVGGLGTERSGGMSEELLLLGLCLLVSGEGKARFSLSGGWGDAFPYLLLLLLLG